MVLLKMKYIIDVLMYKKTNKKHFFHTITIRMSFGYKSDEKKN
jgi:hypothetical protein